MAATASMDLLPLPDLDSLDRQALLDLKFNNSDIADCSLRRTD